MDERSFRNAAASAADDAADDAANLADSARGALNTGVKRARKAAESATDWAADAAGTLSDASLRGYRTAEDAIRLQPVLAVGAALLVGVALGALLFSRDD
jgi:ElaB/YqjD/DUF883 family membrane-anchored ribosome-binding protein